MAVTRSEQDGDHPSGHYLVVEDPDSPSTWHLRVRDVQGNLDHRLMGAAWAALHEGYRSNRYEGPQKQEAISKLRRLYEQEDMPTPGEKSKTVKAVGGDDTWELEVLGVPFSGPYGGRDTDGEYFTPDTDLWLDRIPARPIVYYHGYDDNGQEGPTEIIGKEIGHEVKEDGVWFRVLLDKASALARRVWEAAKEGLAVASSGAISHLVRGDQDGRITAWPIGELSLFEVGTGKSPSNPYAVAIPVVKGVYKRAGLPLPDELLEAEDRGLSGQRSEAVAGGITNVSRKKDRRKKMAENELEGRAAEPNIDSLVRDAVKAALEEERKLKEAEQKAKDDFDAAVAARVEEERKKLEAEAVKAGRLPYGGEGSPHIAEFGELRKYDNLDAADLACALVVLQAAAHKHLGPPPSNAAYKALAVKLAEDESAIGDAGRSAMKAVGIRLDGKNVAMDSVDWSAVKANEIDYTTLTSYGKEFVTTAYSQSVWEKIRLGNAIADRLPSIEFPPGTSQMVLPIEGADPTFYKVAEVTSDAATGGLSKPSPTVQSSLVGTSNTTLSLAVLGARTRYSQEFQESSIIPAAPYIRQKMERAGREYFEHVLIDGDTAATASTNINKITGTPGARDAYLLFNGLRKIPLVTNTDNARSGGSLSADDYRLTSELLGPAGIYAMGPNRNMVSYLVDPNTYNATRALDEVKTKDVFTGATIENGWVTRLWGTEIIPTHMHYASNSYGAYAYKANTSGKIDQATQANNTTGSILAVRWDRWLLGWMRRMTVEIDKDIEAQTHIVVSTMRVGLIYFDTDASAITYNLTV